MGKVNGRQKGARGEREFRDVLRSHGYEARRGQQFSGNNGDADVVHDVPGIYFEVKRKETGNPYNWLKQCTDDCNRSKAKAGGMVRENGTDNTGVGLSESPISLVPVVAHKRNHREWIVVLTAEDFLKILKDRL